LKNEIRYKSSSGQKCIYNQSVPQIKEKYLSLGKKIPRTKVTWIKVEAPT